MNETKIRREMTYNISKNQKESEDQERFKNNIYSDIGKYVKDDQINRSLFLNINSIISGMTFEYNHYSKTHRPLLEIKKYKYFKKDESIKPFNEETMTEIEYALDTKERVNNIKEDYYWDSEILTLTGLKDADVNFFKELDEETMEISQSERPERYSKWISGVNSDYYKYVKDFIPNEIDILNNLSYVSSYDQITGKDFYLISDLHKYNYNLNKNDPCLISISNLEDNSYILFYNNDKFSYGKIKKAGSRYFYYYEFCSNSDTLDFKKGTTVILNYKEEIIKELLQSLKKINEDMIRFLQMNDLEYNDDLVLKYQNIIYKIENLLDKEIITDIEINDFINDYDKTEMFMSERMLEIENYLSTNNVLYNELFDIINQRIDVKNNSGTLLSLLTRKNALDGAMKTSSETREKELVTFGKYFDVYLCEKEGDNYRRVFIKKGHKLRKGDWVYLLTNDEKVPEVYAEIDIIVEGRVIDKMDFDYNVNTDEMKFKYKIVDKIFFKNFVINNKNKKRFKFSSDYKDTDYFRVVKQKLPLPKSF